MSVPLPPAPMRLAPVPDETRADEPFSVIVMFDPLDSPRKNEPLPLMLSDDVLLRVMLPLGKFEVLFALYPALRLPATRAALLFRMTSVETLPMPLPRPTEKKPVTFSEPASMINCAFCPAPPLLTTPPTVTSPVNEYVPPVMRVVP